MQKCVFATVLCCMCSLYAGTAWGQLETINFDEVDVTVPTPFSGDRYQAQGIVFEKDIYIWDIVSAGQGVAADVAANGGTLPNVMSISYLHGYLEVRANFVVPGTDLQGVTDYVAADAFDALKNSGTILAYLRAYDLDGALIQELWSTTAPDNLGDTFEIASPGIASVEFATDSDGNLFDNIRFNTPEAVPATYDNSPESATWLLLACTGVASIVTCRRRS